MNDEDRESLQFPLLTATIRSRCWWACTAMLGELHGYIGSLSSWSESCPCHQWQDRIGSAGRRPVYSEETEMLMALRQASVLTEHFDGPRFDCPLKGKRAVELASGCIPDMLERMSVEHTNTVLRQSAGLGDDTFEIMEDYQHGKNRLMHAAVEKLQHWAHLP